MPRLPLVGSYNTRQGTYALSGASGVIGIGVIGVMIIGNTGSNSSKDHRFINCLQITSVDPIGKTKRLYVVDRPGFAAHSTPEAGSIGNALRVWVGQSSKVMSCFGATNSTLYDATTSKGAITGKATDITETSISGTPTLAITSTDNTAWYYQNGGSATKITDTDFPGNASRTLAGTFAHLKGFALVMDSVGRIYNSDLNSVTAWTADSYITANYTPDVGVGVVRFADYVIGFCKEHFEVFAYADNPIGAPLVSMPGYTKLYGCVSADAITSLKGIVFFVGSDKSANLALYAYSGGEPQQVSSPEIDAALAIAGPANISITRVGFYGRSFIVVMASSSTYVYCIDEQTWHEWVGPRLWHKADGVSDTGTFANYAISKLSTSGKVYVLNPAAVVYADDGAPFTASIQTAKWDAGTHKRKFASQITVIGDQTSSTMNVSWSDDDYTTLTDARQVTMTDDPPRLTRCGAFRRRSFTLAHTADGARLEALDVDITQGVS